MLIICNFTLLLQNPTQVGVAVQVFHNLGTLANTLLVTVKGCSNNVQQQTQDALNPATLTEGNSLLWITVQQRNTHTCWRVCDVQSCTHVI